MRKSEKKKSAKLLKLKQSGVTAKKAANRQSVKPPKLAVRLKTIAIVPTRKQRQRLNAKPKNDSAKPKRSPLPRGRVLRLLVHLALHPTAPMKTKARARFAAALAALHVPSWRRSRRTNQVPRKNAVA